MVHIIEVLLLSVNKCLRFVKIWMYSLRSLLIDSDLDLDRINPSKLKGMEGVGRHYLVYRYIKN
jgi:hypothetical protein